MQFETISPEIAKKFQELEARAQRVIIKNSNPLLKDQTLNTAFETCAVLVGARVEGIHDLSMFDLVMSCYRFKQQKNVLDYMVTYHRYLWKHVETLIEAYETLQLSLQMHITDHDSLLKQLAKEVTEVKLFQHYLKETGKGEEYETFKARYTGEPVQKKDSSTPETTV